MEIPPLLILKPQPSQGGGADDARLVAQLRSGDGGDGSLPLAEAMGGYILPDRGQQGLPLTLMPPPSKIISGARIFTKSVSPAATYTAYRATTSAAVASPCWAASKAVRPVISFT